jgi:uncharacterized membrane protein HdeD (DUF308 family)
MRRAVSFIIAFWLTASGAFSGLYLLLFGVEEKGWMLLGAGFVFIVGATLLYSDFTGATRNEKS